jgi:hypothetical protein
VGLRAAHAIGIAAQVAGNCLRAGDELAVLPGTTPTARAVLLNQTIFEFGSQSAHSTVEDPALRC